MMGDLLTKPASNGGFGFGTVGSSAILITVLIALILYTGWALRRQLRPAEEMAE